MVPISKGYVYSLGGGLLRYDGIRQVLTTGATVQHVFTVVKPLRSTTLDMKPWDKYKTGTGYNKFRHIICIYFTYEIFNLLKYEPALTVLYGRPE